MELDTNRVAQEMCQSGMSWKKQRARIEDRACHHPEAHRDRRRHRQTTTSATALEGEAEEKSKSHDAMVVKDLQQGVWGKNAIADRYSDMTSLRLGEGRTAAD